ncbi:hypothetical protein CPB84DRAFT_1354166 [Gymnopilus junonius]|uniref:Uncharacterized protein n=1 Tax=Gymnopilus junonius TaxID=109634 RepID=A0A9P5NVI6_GYMJU|nr:hypothetical protein CPB84DRAFT_1354166 [Gymnopilus junonius]
MSAAPTVTAEPQSTASSRKPRFYGGHRHYQKFTNSAGELEVTTSSLIIAALLKGQRNSSLRHGTAFGVKVSEAYFMKERDFDMPFIADFDRDSSFPSNNLNGTGPRVVNPAFHGPAPPPPPAPVAVEVPSIEAEVEAEPQEETSEEKHTEEDVQMEAPEPEQVEQADHREPSLPEVTTLEPTVLQQQDEDAIQVDEHEGPNIEATQDAEEKTDGTTPIDQLEPEEEAQQADPVAEPVDADVDGDEDESALTSPTVDTEPEDTRIKPRILSVPADPDEEELEW